MPNRCRAGRDLALKPKAFGNLGKADVGRLFDQTENRSLMLVELRTERLALLAGRRFAIVTIAAKPFPAVEMPIPNRFAALRVESPSEIAIITRPRRSALKPCDMSVSLRINNKTESQNSRYANPQNDSGFFKPALGRRLGSIRPAPERRTGHRNAHFLRGALNCGFSASGRCLWLDGI